MNQPDQRARASLALALILAGLGVGLISSGCNRPLSPKLGPPTERLKSVDGIYPHATSFVRTREHGERFLKDGETCRSCHGKDLGGGNARVSCTQCHRAYPHSEDFKKSWLHGEAFLIDKTSCTSCHSTDGAAPGSPNAKNCQTCHSYPHFQAQWHRKSGHAAAYLKGQDCLKCHGEDSKLKERHPDQFVSCASCHLQMPHPKVGVGHEASFKGHGAAYLANKQSCSECHSLDGSGDPGAAAPSCQSCHAYPHTQTPWFQREKHGAAFLSASADKKRGAQACLSCHGESSEFKERHPKAFVSCGSCHVQMPHPVEPEMPFETGHMMSAGTETKACRSCHTDLTKYPVSRPGGCLNSECHTGRDLKLNQWVDAPSPRPEGNLRPPSKKRSFASEKKKPNPKPSSP